MSCAVLGAKGLTALTCLADVAASVYNCAEAKKVTSDAGVDIGADMAELVLFYCALERDAYLTEREVNIGGPSRDRKVSPGGTQVCFGIMYGTLALINALELLAGLGPPTPAGDFLVGHSRLNAVADVLRKADPDEAAWAGHAAAGYADANRTLQRLVRQAADADSAVAGILHRQAGQVQQVRQELAVIKLTLVGLILFVLALIPACGNYAVLRDAEYERQYDLLDNFVNERDRVAQAYQNSHHRLPFSVYAYPGYGFLQVWLPLIVLPPCIAATISACVVLGLLIAQGNSHAGEVHKQAGAYAVTGVRDAVGDRLVDREPMRSTTLR